MSIAYVWSGAGGLNNGSSWTNAYTSLVTAATEETVADTLYVHKTHTEVLSASATIYLLNQSTLVAFSIYCVDKDNSNALSIMGTGGYIGSTSASYNIAFTNNGTAGVRPYIYGLTFVISGTTAVNINIATASVGTELVMESCRYEVLTTNTTAGVRLGPTTSTTETAIKLINPVFKFGQTAHAIYPQGGKIEIIGATFTSDTAAISPIVKTGGGGYVTFNGCDFTYCGTTLLGDQTSGFKQVTLENCKVPSSLTFLGAQTTYGNLSQAEVCVFNTASGDTHYVFGHYTAVGETVAVTSPYISDGALYDGTNHVSWKITTSANCSFLVPYATPWIETYHAGTSAITPSIEGLMIDDATVAQNDEVWGEFSYQGTSGYTLATLVNDRMAPLGTAGDQTSSKTYSNWTASPATDSGDSVFKLATTSTITPAEIGMLRARVYVGEASKTLYIDPKIRT